MVKLTLRERETAQEAVRRFRKLVERSGIKKEIRIREEIAKGLSLAEALEKFGHV